MLAQDNTVLYGFDSIPKSIEIKRGGYDEIQTVNSASDSWSRGDDASECGERSGE
jgi:hypothetical protein